MASGQGTSVSLRKLFHQQIQCSISLFAYPAGDSWEHDDQEPWHWWGDATECCRGEDTPRPRLEPALWTSTQENQSNDSVRLCLYACESVYMYTLASPHTYYYNNIIILLCAWCANDHYQLVFSNSDDLLPTLFAVMANYLHWMKMRLRILNKGGK